MKSDLCSACINGENRINTRKLGFKGKQDSNILNQNRYKKNGSWLDARATEDPRRSSPSTAPCNWLEEVLNMWNTNQSCTIDSGRVINYLLNYIGKKEVTSKDVARAIRDAVKHFSGEEKTTVMKLLKRALHRSQIRFMYREQAYI